MRNDSGGPERVFGHDGAGIVAAIQRGQADVLASNVTPRERVAHEVGATVSADPSPPAERAVVWSRAAMTVYRETIQRLAKIDKAAADLAATRVDRAGAALGHDASGAPGRVEHTFEVPVPETAFVLVYEIVTWTKAGEVIALLHLIDLAA